MGLFLYYSLGTFPKFISKLSSILQLTFFSKIDFKTVHILQLTNFSKIDFIIVPVLQLKNLWDELLFYFNKYQSTEEEVA